MQINTLTESARGAWILMLNPEWELPPTNLEGSCLSMKINLGTVELVIFKITFENSILDWD